MMLLPPDSRNEPDQPSAWYEVFSTALTSGGIAGFVLGILSCIFLDLEWAVGFFANGCLYSLGALGVVSYYYRNKSRDHTR